MADLNSEHLYRIAEYQPDVMPGTLSSLRGALLGMRDRSLEWDTDSFVVDSGLIAVQYQHDELDGIPPISTIVLSGFETGDPAVDGGVVATYIAPSVGHEAEPFTDMASWVLAVLETVDPANMSARLHYLAQPGMNLGLLNNATFKAAALHAAVEVTLGPQIDASDLVTAIKDQIGADDTTARVIDRETTFGTKVHYEVTSNGPVLDETLQIITVAGDKVEHHHLTLPVVPDSVGSVDHRYEYTSGQVPTVGQFAVVGYIDAAGIRLLADVAGDLSEDH